MGTGEQLTNETFNRVTLKMPSRGGAETSVVMNSIRPRPSSLGRNNNFTSRRRPREPKAADRLLQFNKYYRVFESRASDEKISPNVRLASVL